MMNSNKILNHILLDRLKLDVYHDQKKKSHETEISEDYKKSPIMTKPPCGVRWWRGEGRGRGGGGVS